MEFYDKPQDKYDIQNGFKEGNYFCRPFKLKGGRYGPAITFVWEDEEGRLWADNLEYQTQINYCPFTGKEAKIKL